MRAESPGQEGAGWEGVAGKSQDRHTGFQSLGPLQFGGEPRTLNTSPSHSTHSSPEAGVGPQERVLALSGGQRPTEKPEERRLSPKTQGDDKPKSLKAATAGEVTGQRGKSRQTRDGGGECTRRDVR